VWLRQIFEHNIEQKNPQQETGEVGRKEGHEVVHVMRHSMREKEQMNRRNGNVRMV
jgi:hypothetical protein